MSRLAIMLVLFCSTLSLAQGQPTGDDPLPSLDELLGLEQARPDKPAHDQGAEGPVDSTRADLDRSLTARQARDSLAQAAQLMGDAAERLARASDVGIETQRIQEDILRKLDQVIAAAEQQQSQSSSSSSQQQQQQQQQQRQQRREQQQRASASPENAQEGPPRQDGDLSGVRPANSAAWGRLPARTRDALIEGLRDRYSSLYERMTEAYYRRLAEDHP